MHSIPYWTDITFSNGCLGYHDDEERSEMWYVMRIARARESLRFWTHIVLRVSPGSLLAWVSLNTTYGARCCSWYVIESRCEGFVEEIVERCSAVEKLRRSAPSRNSSLLKEWNVLQWRKSMIVIVTFSSDEFLIKAESCAWRGWQQLIVCA